MEAGAETTLPTIAFEAGSSIVGWVKTEGGSPVDGASVELLNPDGDPILSATGPRQRPYVVSTNSLGFFQVVSVPPADYRLVARGVDVSSQAVEVRILKDQETRLTTPIVVGEPLSLEVTVDPPMDPSETPWLVSLLAGDPPHPSFIVREESIATTGHWRKDGLSPGSYRLIVSTARAKWFTTRFDLKTGLESLHARIPVLRIRGRARSGDAPIHGSLVFRNDDGARVALETDENGAFRGSLPQLATETRSWSVSVTSRTPLMRRSVEGVEVSSHDGTEAWVEVTLPDTRLEGRLVGLDGQPYGRKAIVSAQLTEGSISIAQGLVRPEDAGRFRLEGLTPGAYWVSAEGDRAESDRVSVVLPEDSDPSPVRLVMREQNTLDGRVISPGGTGVPGAEVLAFPANLPGSLVSPQRTDADGRFRLPVVQGTRDLCLSVGAPGFAYKILRRSVRDDDLSVVVSLERDGGTLLLEDFKDPAGQVGTTAYLLREGSFEALNSLLRWAGANGGAKSPDGRMVIPNLAAGEYVVCWAHMNEVAALVFGGLPRSRCVSGTLVPGGELTLALPAVPDSGG